MTYKDIILEALNRSNLVPRKRTAPSDMLESAQRLLNGIIDKYNFSNFISFTRNELDVIPTEEKIVFDTEITNIDSVQYKLNENEWNPLRFVSYEQFYNDNDTYVYTWKFNIDNQIELYLKPNFLSSNRTLKVIYNSPIHYDLNDTLSLPSIYIELFTSALAYKLSMVYPRTDSTQVSLLKNDLDEIETKVKGMISSNKIITRDVGTPTNLSSFMSGSFIFGR